MEVLLNTTWLMVAIAAFLFWQVEMEGTPGCHKHNRRYAVLALTVVLILLFPVISLTDDLHAEQAAMEESSRSVIKARNTLQSCLRSGRASIVATVTHAADPATALRLFLGTVILIEAPLQCLTPVSAHNGRSPPFHI